MLGGRPLQNIAADLHGDAAQILDHRPAGFSRTRRDQRRPERHECAPGPSGSFKARSTSNRPIRIRWWRGCRAAAKSPIAVKSRCACAAMSASAPDRIAIDAMKAEIDGGAVEGRVAVSSRIGRRRLRGSMRSLKAERLDLDAATAFARSLAGPQAEWPDEAQLSLDIGRAISAGQELHPLMAKFGYGPKAISLDQLKIGEASGVTLEGTGSFDRVNTTGQLALNSSAASLGQITAADRAVCAVIWRRGSMRWAQFRSCASQAGARSRQGRTQHADRASARAVLDLDAPQLKGVATITGDQPEIAAMRAIDLDRLSAAKSAFESKLSSEQGRPLLALLGLDRAIAAGEGPAQFQGSVTGVGTRRCG